MHFHENNFSFLPPFFFTFLQTSHFLSACHTHFKLFLQFRIVSILSISTSRRSWPHRGRRINKEDLVQRYGNLQTLQRISWCTSETRKHEGRAGWWRAAIPCAAQNVWSFNCPVLHPQAEGGKFGTSRYALRPREGRTGWQQRSVFTYSL